MEEARKRKPCILFLDEIDSIGRKRKQDEKESMRRIKNELLKQMDGIGSKNEGVVVLAATNGMYLWSFFFIHSTREFEQTTKHERSTNMI